MGNKKHAAARVASQVSSAQSLSTSASTHRANASVIHKAAFAPSRLQLSLFASVVQSLHGHQLRIHDTVSGDLQNEHELPGERIASVDWGTLGDAAHLLESKTSKKKKRRLEETNGTTSAPGEVVVALGSDQPGITFYSPAQGRTVMSIQSGHTAGVKMFRFANYGLDGIGWSLGVDHKLVQWDIGRGAAIRTIESPAGPLSCMVPCSSSLLVASHDTWLIDLTADDKLSQVGSGAHSVHTIVTDAAPGSKTKPHHVVTAAQDERQVLIYDSKGKQPRVSTFNASGAVEALILSEIEDTSDKFRSQALAAITTRGELELLLNPFRSSSVTNGATDPKSKLKNQTRRADAVVSIVHTGRKDPLPLAGAGFFDNELVIAYVEGGARVSFERVQVFKSGSDQLLLAGHVEIEKPRHVIGAENGERVGSKLVGRTQMDENNALISYGQEDTSDTIVVDDAAPIMISSADEDSSDSEAGEIYANGDDTAMAGTDDRISPSKDDDTAVDSAARLDEEPTFGDLLHSHGSKTVDVSEDERTHRARSMVPYLQTPSGGSTNLTLTNALSQALRTNDTTLLESCLHEQDRNIVRSTIERLDSSVATVLLQKLAEKLHSRPGRSGSLMIWIQWTLVSHGGYLGSQPDTIKKLAALQRVVTERANSLQPLLNLKGKLDMLEAQMNLRRSMLNRMRHESPMPGEADSHYVYVEPMDDTDASEPSSDEDDEDEDDEDEDEDEEDQGLDSASSGDSEEMDRSDNDDRNVVGLVTEDASEHESTEDDLDAEVDYEDVDSVDDEEDRKEEESEGNDAAPSRTSKMPNGIR